MDYSAPQPLPGLTDALVSRARSASNRRLAFDVAIGLLVATSAPIWKPGGWLLLACAAICFAAFGAWGFAERHLDGSAPAERRPFIATLLVLRPVAIVLGVLAAAILIFGAAGAAMGTWIS